jgi:hypothetical protein
MNIYIHIFNLFEIYLTLNPNYLYLIILFLNFLIIKNF